MGVSGLLRNILKKYPSIHLPAPHPNIKIDYLFIDFNAFIYNTIYAFPKVVVYNFSKNKENSSYEKELVKLVIKNTLELVNIVPKAENIEMFLKRPIKCLLEWEQNANKNYINIFKLYNF